MTLHSVFQSKREVVAEVIETEFVVGTVSDIATVGGALLFGALRVANDTDRQTEKTIDRPHPLGVTLREIFVDGDDVYALSGQRIQVGRQSRHQSLAFTGAHLGDAPSMQRHATDQLHIEVPHAEHASGGLADDGKGFR